MKQRRKAYLGIFAAVCMFILVFDSKLAIEGALSGIDLCLHTVIPSLFPFFILSMVLTDSLEASNNHWIEPIATILGISKEAAPVFIPAILGGYPVGAKCTHDLFVKKRISRIEAERLLSFCSNAGPSFLLGMVSSSFPQKRTVWLIWIIQLASAVLTSLSIPSVKAEKKSDASNEELQNKKIISSAVKAMANVCCWVLLFRIILSFLDSWFLWALPDWTKVMLAGLLELANGCCVLTLITDIHHRFVLCACLLTFGGICVLMQTAAVIEGLSIYPYIKGKLIQTVYCFLLCNIFTAKNSIVFAAMIPIIMIFLRKIQIKCSNPKIVPV